MKKFFFLVLFAAVSIASAQNLIVLKKMVQPQCAIKCVAATDFSTTDSSFYPVSRVSGQRYVAHGLAVHDTGFLMIHPSANTDTTVRYPFYIGPNDKNNECGFSFDKIFKTGSTVNLDSVWVFLFLDN